MASIANSNLNKGNVKAVLFTAYAQDIAKGYRVADQAAVKLRDVVNMTMQKFVDAWMAQNDKSEESIKSMQRAITGNEVVIKLVSGGAMEKKTFTEYAASAARAAYHAVPFQANLKNDPSYALPWGKVKSTDKPQAAANVVSTSRTDLDKTLVRALQQARLLGLPEFAAQLLDLCVDSLDGFSEPKGGTGEESA